MNWYKDNRSKSRMLLDAKSLKPKEIRSQSVIQQPLDSPEDTESGKIRKNYKIRCIDKYD